MRIGLQTWGSDGDIRPFAALAGGLSSAGHDVTLALTSIDNKDYSQLGEALGFKTVPVANEFYSLNEEQLGQIPYKMLQTRNLIKQSRILLEHTFEPILEDLYGTAKQLCAENDLVIGHFLLHPALLAAEKTQKPCISIFLNHMLFPSRNIVPFGLPDLGRWMNPIWWKLVVTIVDRENRGSINTLRIREGMAPFKRVVAEAMHSEILEMILVAVSSTICPRQPDWDERVYVCGFFSVPDQAEPWSIPEDLQRFLNAGGPPIYMTLGSMISVETSTERLTDITRLLIKAAKLAGARAIIQSRWEDITTIPEDSDIYRITKAPHQYVFPHCSAVVHHGGSGTTQSATRCGCPSVVVEHFLDQPFWGYELKRLGLTSKVLHRRSITAAELGREIRTVISSPAMQKKAQHIAGLMKNEDGVGRAVELIQKRFQEKWW
jgi:UDP:flavonoid glycosyltransferase YjiC (YdhE family)